MSDRRRLSIALAAAAVAVSLAGPVAAASAVTRFAAPNLATKTGAGGPPCTDPLKPCTLLTALDEADPTDDVQLAAGNYWLVPGELGSTPLPYDNPIIVRQLITVHGPSPSGPVPIIHVAPDGEGEAGIKIGRMSGLQDVAIEGTAVTGLESSSSLVLDPLAFAQRIRVRTSGASGSVQTACRLAEDTTLRSSVCHGRGGAAGGRVTAVVAASGEDASFSIRNVTAITTAPSSDAVRVSTSSATATANISNSILRGTATDLSVFAGTGGTAVANVDHSNWVTQSVSDAGGASSATVDGLGGNQNAATAVEPLFANAAAGDFRALPGSPTIDAGVVDVTNNGPLALGGENRKVGKTTDIGAFEFDPADVAPDPTPTPTPTPTVAPPIGGNPLVIPPGSPLLAPPADTLAPQLSGLSLGRTVKRARGTSIRFSLSEPATVLMTFSQPKSGRVVAGRCRTQTSKNRKRRKCTIPNVRGTLTFAGRAGANTVAFKGTLSRGKRLALGGYTLAATPTDAAGNRGASAVRSFTLKR